LQDDLLKARTSFKQLFVRSGAWLLDQGLSVAIVLVVTIFLMRFFAALIKTAFSVYEQRIAAYQDEYVQRRSQTLSTIFRGVAQAIIFFIGLMVALQQGGLNITPILASAGILGLAIGFGAQSLIKDLFAGLMILFEEQYSVGDTIKIGDVTGTVESLTLRSTRVRGGDGALTIFPNGNISTVANLSKDWLRVVLDFDVDYAADIEAAMKLMSEVAARLKAERPTEILEEPVMQGIDKVGGGIVTLRLIFKTVPTKQAEISRELRRRVKAVFDQAGIKVPGKANP
jgi:moderate conductance mechanosensitive channel